MRLYRAAAKVAELPIVIDPHQDVLRLDISVGDRRLLRVHADQALHDICCDQQYLVLGEALGPLVCPLVNQAHQIAALAELVQQKYLLVTLVASGHGVLTFLEEGDDVRVFAELA